jgi:hypothetical protein
MLLLTHHNNLIFKEFKDRITMDQNLLLLAMSLEMLVWVWDWELQMLVLQDQQESTKVVLKTFLQGHHFRVMVVN